MQIVDIIGELIETIRETGIITSIGKNGSLYTIYTSDTKGLKENQFVTISGNSYKILNLQSNQFFTVQSSLTIIGTKWKANAPYYYYGTPIAINNTLTTITDANLKYPIVVLFEIIKKNINNDELNQTGLTPDLKMFFMNNANYNDWTTKDHYDKVINPMQILVDKFLEACNKSKFVNFYELKEFQTVNHAKWGLYVENKGAIKSIFNDNLSGIELNISLPIMRYYASC